jgi:hypothetical protein
MIAQALRLLSNITSRHRDWLLPPISAMSSKLNFFDPTQRVNPDLESAPPNPAHIQQQVMEDWKKKGWHILSRLLLLTLAYGVFEGIEMEKRKRGHHDGSEDGEGANNGDDRNIFAQSQTGETTAV